MRSGLFVKLLLSTSKIVASNRGNTSLRGRPRSVSDTSKSCARSQIQWVSLSSLIPSSPFEQIIPSESTPLITLLAIVIPASGNGVPTRAVATKSPSATFVPPQMIWNFPCVQQFTWQILSLSASGCFSTCSIFPITIERGICLSITSSISQVLRIKFFAISWGVVSRERYFLRICKWYFIASWHKN